MVAKLLFLVSAILSSRCICWNNHKLFTLVKFCVPTYLPPTVSILIIFPDTNTTNIFCGIVASNCSPQNVFFFFFFCGILPNALVENSMCPSRRECNFDSISAEVIQFICPIVFPHLVVSRHSHHYSDEILQYFNYLTVAVDGPVTVLHN